MQATVQKFGDDLIVRLPRDVINNLHLIDGSKVDVSRVDAPAEDSADGVLYLSDEEAGELFDKVEPLHKNTLHELAK